MNIKMVIKNVINSYYYKYKTFDYNEDNAINAITDIENYLFNEKLGIDIAIPILFLLFDFEDFEIDTNVHLKRIDESLHFSRSYINAYNVNVNDSVLDSATHMLVISDYVVANSVYGMDFKSLSNPQVYPLDKIGIFSAQYVLLVTMILDMGKY